jgi:hypothetical protein
MLTDERIDELWLSPMSFDWEHREFARLVEAEATAPLLARIAELEAALKGLDEAYCRAGPNLTREERAEDRRRLIAARAAMKEQP